MPSQSKDGGVAGRYASALYELAESAKALDKVADDLRALRGLIDECPDFARVVVSPVLGREAQTRAVTAVAEKTGLHELTVKLLGTLGRNRRLNALKSVIGAYLAELADRRGEVTAQVTTASELKTQHLDAVREALAGALGTKVALESRVDPSLIGGMIVRVGSKMVDSSLSTKLQKLRLSMKGIG